MSSLFAALRTSSDALDVMERAMGVIQNNVTNASTPGYVTQTLNLMARAFNPGGSLWGGVQAGEVEDSRNSFAEEAVWSQNSRLGTATQLSASLGALQSVFDVSGQSGIPAALSTLYSAFSAWSTTPADATKQQQVMTAAQGVVQAFHLASQDLQQISSQTDRQLQASVGQINQLTSQIAAMNGQIRNGDRNDAGLEANLYDTLEKLSNLTAIQVQKESDGTVTVLMGGQTPLVLGTTQTQLSVTFLGSVGPPAPIPGAPPNAHIVTNSGQDVTSIISGGQIAAVIQFRNVTLPSITGDGQHQGSLNQLAQAIADRVNGLLTSGQTSSGATGIPLFTYNAGTLTSVAGTLSLNSALTASQLAAADPTGAANGIALQLAQLSNSADPALQMSYTDYYSSVASDIGSQAATASTDQETQTQLLTQAQDLRSQLSGVSLNEQAANLLQFQQAYEASAQMISVINNTTQYLMSMMQSL